MDLTQKIKKILKLISFLIQMIGYFFHVMINFKYLDFEMLIK